MWSRPGLTSLVVCSFQDECTVPLVLSILSKLIDDQVEANFSELLEDFGESRIRVNTDAEERW